MEPSARPRTKFDECAGGGGEDVRPLVNMLGCDRPGACMKRSRIRSLSSYINRGVMSRGEISLRGGGWCLLNAMNSDAARSLSISSGFRKPGGTLGDDDGDKMDFLPADNSERRAFSDARATSCFRISWIFLECSAANDMYEGFGPPTSSCGNAPVGDL